MEKLKLEDFIDYKFISGIKISPENSYVGFAVHRADLEENKYLSNIWVYDKKEEECLKLTSMDAEKSFIWLDEKTILFPSIRSEKDKKKLEEGEELTVFYSIRTSGGEAQEAFRVNLSVTSIEKLDDDRFVLTAGWSGNKPNPLPKDYKDYEVMDEIPFWSNGGGFTNKKRNRLYIYDRRNGKAVSVTDELTDVSGYKIKENKILYVSVKYNAKMPLTSELKIYDIETGNTELLVTGGQYKITYADYIENTVVMAATEMKRYGLNENPWFYTVDKEGVRLLAENDYSLWNSVGSDCRLGSSEMKKSAGSHLYFTATKARSSFLCRIDLCGKVEELSKDRGSVDGFDIAGDEAFFIGLRGQKLQEVYSLSEGRETQLTNLNKCVMEDRYTAVPERVEFQNEDVTIEGFILKPIDYDPSRKYPAVLDIHGGPKTVYGEVFYHEMQYWANQGYFVFFCNPRGSDGKGNAFADIRGKYGTIDYDDLMKFTDLVLDKYPQIDRKRVGVTGGSYGGFMTNWIIGHTDRFRCAATQRSIANWVTEFGVTDIGYYFVPDQIAADPWSNIEKLWDHSPMKYADKIKTPTLIIHSDEDYRCWLPEGLQLFTSLKYHGVESRLCMFKGENHELSRSGKPKHRIKRLQEITNWFEKYLK